MKIKLLEPFDLGHKILSAGAIVDIEQPLAEKMIEEGKARKAHDREESFMHPAMPVGRKKRKQDENPDTETHTIKPEAVLPRSGD